MVDAQITGDILELRLRGLHKLWAFKDSIQIPLAAIDAVRADAERARAGPEGVRNPGTSVPGLLTAGTFTAGVERTFWDVHNPDNAISIKLRSTRELFSSLDDRFDELVVEVADPVETAGRINLALQQLG